MDTYSLTAAARVLGTSAPRVRRAVDRLGMPVERTASGVFRLTPQQVDELARELGAVPPVPALSRVETRVLAALSRSPRGVASVREAARRAGVSPTATSVALARLARGGLITATPVMLAMGHAVESTVYQVRFGSPDGLSSPRRSPASACPPAVSSRARSVFRRTCCTCSGTQPRHNSTWRPRRRSSPAG